MRLRMLDQLLYTIQDNALEFWFIITNESLFVFTFPIDLKIGWHFLWNNKIEVSIANV